MVLLKTRRPAIHDRCRYFHLNVDSDVVEYRAVVLVPVDDGIAVLLHLGSLSRRTGGTSFNSAADTRGANG